MTSLPSNYGDRPVAVLGGGVLGRRIGEFDLLLTTLLGPQPNTSKQPAHGHQAATTSRSANPTPTNTSPA